jgi:hypothetical protein
MAKFEITWEAPEFEYREKEVSWYWLSIIIASLIVAFSVWERNFLFGFFIVIAEILFIIWGNRVPRMTIFVLSDSEIRIGDYKTYLLKEFESWSVNIDGGEWIELAFYFRSKLHTPLVIITPEEELADVRTNLKGVLKEIEHDMSLVDSIEKFLRF